MLSAINTHNVIKYDMNLELFKYWKAFFLQNIRQEWIDKEQLPQISIFYLWFTVWTDSLCILEKALQENLPYKVTKEWIIVFGKDLGYNLQ